MWYALPIVGISASKPSRRVNAAGAASPNSDGEKFSYVYNPWGQLVEIKKIGGGSVTNAKYTYSAMGHRISEQLDTNDSSNSGVGDGPIGMGVDAYDPKFFIATDPVGGGRRLATYRGTDYDPKETFIHHDARIRGPVHQGGPILRDRNASLATAPEEWASVPADSDRYERHYYVLDYRGYVSAIVTGDAKLVEQVRYSATGVPFNIPLGDVNADGKVQAGSGSDADWSQIDYMWKTPAYHVRGDLDLDGDVDAADLAIAQARDGTVTGRGYLTQSTTCNVALLPSVEYTGYQMCTATLIHNAAVLRLDLAIIVSAGDTGWSNPTWKKWKKRIDDALWLKDCYDCMVALYDAAKDTEFDPGTCSKCCDNYVCKECPTDRRLPLDPNDREYDPHGDGYTSCTTDCFVCCETLRCQYLGVVWKTIGACVACAKYPNGTDFLIDFIGKELGVGDCNPFRFGVDLRCTKSALAKLMRCKQRKAWDKCPDPLVVSP